MQRYNLCLWQICISWSRFSFYKDIHAFKNKINWKLWLYSSVIMLNCILRSDFSICQHSAKVQFLKGYTYCISGLAIFQQLQPPLKFSCKSLQIWILFPNIYGNIPQLQHLPSKGQNCLVSQYFFTIVYKKIPKNTQLIKQHFQSKKTVTITKK